MRPSLFALSASSFALGALLFLAPAGSAEARDGFAGPRMSSSFKGGGAGFHGRWNRPGHGHARFRGVPLYLDDGDSDRVSVRIEQIFAPVVAAPAFPSVMDLPVSAGIRQARAAQPAIYVLNEGAPRRETSIRPLQPSGPKIVSALPGTDFLEEEPGPSFGARIIHLTVPVGPRS